MKEIMIYGALNSEFEIVWGIYKRNSELNWSKFYTASNYRKSGLVGAIQYVLEYCKDCIVLFGGYWYNHEQLTEKLYEILDNM